MKSWRTSEINSIRGTIGYPWFSKGWGWSLFVRIRDSSFHIWLWNQISRGEGKVTGSRSRSKEAAAVCVEFLVTRHPTTRFPTTRARTPGQLRNFWQIQIFPGYRYLQWRGVNPAAPVRTRQISIWKIRDTYKCSCQSQLAPVTPLSFASCLGAPRLRVRGSRVSRKHLVELRI